MFKKRIKWVRLAASSNEFTNGFPPSGLVKRVIESKSICFVKKGPEIYAVGNRCPHQGASLSNGTMSSDGFLVCPWHRYGFDCKTGRGPGYFLEIFPLQENEDGFYIGIKKGWLEI